MFAHRKGQVVLWWWLMVARAYPPIDQSESVTARDHRHATLYDRCLLNSLTWSARSSHCAARLIQALVFNCYRAWRANIDPWSHHREKLINSSHRPAPLCIPRSMISRGPSFWGRHYQMPWWRHQMETFYALLAICAGNSPISDEFPTQRPVTRNFDVFFDLRRNKRLRLVIWDAIAPIMTSV